MTLPALPIDTVLPQVLEALGRAPRRVIVEAPPGAGKTTRIPYELLNLPSVSGRVVVTEPRRIAARLAATRVSKERGSELGDEVGYSVRSDERTSRRTRLVYVTEGLLLRRFLGDPDLEGVSALVFDEIHEQGADLELLVALSKNLQERRPELALVFMSATLNTEELSAYLPETPVVRSEGRTFDVTVEFAERSDDRPLEVQVRSALRGALRTELGARGDALVFLPGAREIERAYEALRESADFAEREVVRLHGDLPLEEQARATAPSPSARRVVLATNVAESSLTLPNVTTVIDSGLARVSRHDPWSGIASLELEEISQARVVQRSGRAGRTGPGQAYRLFTRGNFSARTAHDTPELLRTNLTEVLLFLLAAGLAPETLPLLHAPTAAQWEKARQELALLGATAHGELTSIGRRMARLPVPARVARFVVAAEDFGILDEALPVAGLLAERDILRRTRPDQRDLHAGDSDLDDRLARYFEAERERFSPRVCERLNLDGSTARRVQETVRQLRSDTRSGGTDSEADRGDALKRALFVAYPDRVAERRGETRSLLLMTGTQATLAETSVLPRTPLLLAFAIDAPGGKAREPVVRLAMKLTADELLELAGDAIEASERYYWSEEKERVECESILAYGKVALDRETKRASAGVEAARVLSKVLIAKGPASYDPDGHLERLLVRVELLREHASTDTMWLADGARAALAALPGDASEVAEAALAGAVAGATTLAEVRATNLGEAAVSSLPFDLVKALDDTLPSHVVLPGGLRVAVHYEPARPPWIEARLQNFFSVKTTPTILGGRLPLQVHLLAPNHRAVQVTSDLAGFWEKHYPALRKELMRKYPKHLWPEDGATAAPPTPGKIR